jgi:chorismate mutase
MKERMSDLLTDALRAQILRLLGYRVDVIEFIGGEHTPRNLMIRAVKTGAKPDIADVKRYEEMIAMWRVKPALAERLEKELIRSTTA